MLFFIKIKLRFYTTTNVHSLLLLEAKERNESIKMSKVNIDTIVFPYVKNEIFRNETSVRESYDAIQKKINYLVIELNEQLCYTADDELRAKIMTALREIDVLCRDYKKKFHVLLNEIDAIGSDAKTVLNHMERDVCIYCDLELHSGKTHADSYQKGGNPHSMERGSSERFQYVIGEVIEVDAKNIHLEEDDIQFIDSFPREFWNMHGRSWTSWYNLGEKFVKVNALLAKGSALEDIKQIDAYREVVRTFFIEDPSRLPKVGYNGKNLVVVDDGRHRVLIAKRFNQKIKVKIVKC